jgi:hypothetical protein
MIKKVAEAQTTRMAVQVCSGTYSPDEMPEHLLKDENNKAAQLNKAYNLYDGEKIDQETGEVIQPESKLEKPEVDEVKPFSNCPYGFEEIKNMMLEAKEIQALSDAAAFISQMEISKEEHTELKKIYREKVAEIKKEA